jgi:hypothetical protein
MPKPEDLRRNYLLFLIVIAAILGSAFVTTSFYSHKTVPYKPGQSSDYDKAVGQALILFNQQKQLDADLSSGPCLSNDLIPGWVADIVHSPRTKQDNLPENECQAYLEGRATHFVELDVNGNVVRVE